MYIKDLRLHEGKSVTLKGWAANKRESKGLVFVILRDGTGLCQCVVDASKVSEDTFTSAQQISLETSVSITGMVVKDDRQVGGYELQAEAVSIIGQSVDYPIAKKEHGVEFLMDHRHLWLRSQRQWAIMKIRNRIIYAIHQFFQEQGYVQMDAPLFTANAVEGTSTLFETDFYGDPAYLSQSGQLYGEAMAMAMGKIYTFGPTFRAEKSKTRRHLSEFWMIEPEMAFHDIFQNMNVIEAFLRHVVLAVIADCKSELESIGRDVSKLEHVTKPFPRLTYDEAVRIIKGEQDVNGQNAITSLEQELEQVIARTKEVEAEIAEREEKMKVPGMKKGEIGFNQAKIDKLKQELGDLEEAQRNIPNWLNSARNFEYGNDFGGSDETVITRLFDLPIMVYNWPHEVKAFYLKRDPGQSQFARGVDVLAPEGYGEIVGGGERETDLTLLIAKINEHQLPMDAFEWYLDLRRFGSVPHAGFGLGLERLVTWICKLPHVRESIPFPRMYGRLKP
ncbi:MAG: OB-fold nucleic acid binding domain-containing protein [Bacteroidia bacterium]|jgi:asparaginyl-tRNA synthetase|nr:OB-fold nucleic acid binding domain-containing protein [Bacteroidia bacterium]